MVDFLTVDGNLAFFLQDLDLNVLLGCGYEFDIRDAEPARHAHIAHFFFKMLVHVGGGPGLEGFAGLRFEFEFDEITAAGDNGGFEVSGLRG